MAEPEQCAYLCVHQEAVDQVLEDLPPDEHLYDLDPLRAQGERAVRLRYCTATIHHPNGGIASAAGAENQQAGTGAEGRQKCVLRAGGRSCA